jgi:hypothetical protein
MGEHNEIWFRYEEEIMNEVRELEKSLKRFLKNRVAVTMGLLVSFLISGNINAKGEQPQPREITPDPAVTASTLLERISAQKEEILALLAENEAKLRAAEESYERLLRQGDYYAKPVYRSSQVFFNGDYYWGAAGRDRTDAEFRVTLDAVEKEVRENGIETLRMLSDEEIARLSGGKTKEELTPEEIARIARYTLNLGNGTVVNGTGHRIEVDLGVHINPLTPVITDVERAIEISVTSPQITAPVLNFQAPTAPALGTLTPPSIQVAVANPGTIPPLNVTIPAAPDPTAPPTKVISVVAPAMPNDYEPTMVTIPDPPTTPVISISSLPTTDFVAGSIGNVDVIYVDNPTGVNAFISNVAVLGGKFTVSRTSNLTEYDYTYEDYVVNTYLGPTAGYVQGGMGYNEPLGYQTIAMPDVTTPVHFINGWVSGMGAFTGTGIQGAYISLIGTYNNGDWLVSRTLENPAVNLGEFAHIDNHGAANSFADIRAALNSASALISPAVNTRVLAAWDDVAAVSQYVGAIHAGIVGYSPRGIMWTNSGNIILEGGNMSLTNQYNHATGYTGIYFWDWSVENFAINAGNLVIRPYIDAGGTLYDSYNAGFLVSNDSAGTNQEVMYNSGNMYIYTNNSAAFVINSVNGIGHSNSGAPNVGVHGIVVNRGKIEMTGLGSLGVFARSDIMNMGSLYMDFTDDGTNGRNPIELFGDASIGLYVTQAYDPIGAQGIGGNFHVNIGASGVGNKALNVAAADTDNGQAIVNYYGDNDVTDLAIQGSVGILSFKPMILDSHGIIIYDKTKNCIGVVPLNGANLVIGTGTVQLTGGENNIGLLAGSLLSGGVTYTGGDIVSTGDVDMSGGDRNIGVTAKDGRTITLDTIGTSTATRAANAIGLFAEGAGSQITVTSGIGANNPLKLTIDLASTNNHTTMAALARPGATINMDVAALPVQPQVDVAGVIDGANYRGYAFLANGGTINARRNYVKVAAGAAGIIALNGGEIHMENGKIDYSGRGFAVYTDTNPATKVYLNDGEIILRGKSVGFTLDVAGPVGVSNVDFGTSGRITMMSNDAVALNLINMSSITLTNLISKVQSGTSNVQVLPGTEAGVTYDKYRLAATDGGVITIDIPIDKSHDASYPTYDPSFFFFRSFLAQKSIVQIDQNVTAQLRNQDAADYFKGYVSGMEMNSSPSAASVYDSQVVVRNGAEILADRIDAGMGAIGVYVNFGVADIQAGTKIHVETPSSPSGNVINDGGIGVYGVDGAIIQNNGAIAVAGNRGVGLLGLAYRTDSFGQAIGQEFGGIAGEGATVVTNDAAGSIEIKGDKAIGAYALNNSNDPAAPAGTPVTVLYLTNNGKIEAGTSAGAKNAVGVYADGDVKVNIGATSAITTGEEGIAVYGANGAEIQTLGGAFTLGKNGIAVLSDGSAAITATGTFTLSGPYVTGASGKIAIAYASQTTGVLEMTPQSLNLSLNLSGLDHGTGIYVKDKGSVAMNGNITVGNTGVGIYLDNGDVTNNGTITLPIASPAAVGMYTIKGKITNAAGGMIQVNHGSQFGITGIGSAAVADNLGAINLAADGAVGVLLQNGASLLNQGTINFGSSTKSFAIVADRSNVTLSGTPPVYVMANSARNVYVFAKNASTVNLVGNIIIDGVAASGSDKSVGIFLDGTGGANTVTATGSLEVRNGAVGIYSKDNNNLFNGTYTAAGNQTVAIYFEDAGNLNGTVINADAGASGANAIGVYAAGGGDITVGPLGIAVNLGPNRGTGLYMTNGAAAKGGLITVTNTGASTNPGLYYINTAVTHATDLRLLGSNTLGLYAGQGIVLTNNHNIFYGGTGNLVGAYAGENATYISGSAGDVITTPNSAGIYVSKGTGINTGSLTIASVTGAAMVAKGEAASTATIENRGLVTVNQGVALLLGDTTGMSPAAGTSVGKNSGNIAVHNGAIGAALSNYDASTFDGTGGTFTIQDGTAIFARNTAAGAIAATGNLLLQSANALGIYADNAVVDFPVVLSGTGGTGVYATGAADIRTTVDASATTGTVGVYIDGGGAGVSFHNAVIKAGSGNSAVGLFFDNLGAYALQGVSIYADGSGSVGVYAMKTALTDRIISSVDHGAIGFFIGADSAAGPPWASTYTSDGATLLIGDGGTGIYNQGTANLGTTGPLTINFTGTGGIAVYNAGGTLNFGTMITIGGPGSGTVAATVDGNLSNTGTLNISGKSIGLIGKYTQAGTFTITNQPGAEIHATAGGTGMAAIDGGSPPPAPSTVTLTNDGILTADGADSIGIFTDIGTVRNNTVIDVSNGAAGVYVRANGAIANAGIIHVKSGIGIVADGVTAAGTGIIHLLAGSPGNYSIGVYYSGITGTPTFPTIDQQGSHSIGIAVVDSVGVVLGSVNLTGTASNQVGRLLKNTSGTMGSVQASGDGNIGVYAENSAITAGNITAGPATNPNDAVVGVYGKDAAITAGNVAVGQNSVGIYGERTTVAAKDLIVGDTGVGVYGKGAGDHSRSLTVSGDMTVGESGAQGVYGSGVDIAVNAPNGVTVGKGTSAAVISEGTGDLIYDADTTVAPKGTSDGSMVIYRKGDAGIMNTSGVWNIGQGSYGLFVKGADPTGTAGGISIANSANITLGEAAVGIFADATEGKVVLVNTGTVKVGPTALGPAGDHLDTDSHENSVGVYLAGGARMTNPGTVIADEDHSVGVYALGKNTWFENTGTINVANGGIGILAKTFGEAVNSGLITVLNGKAPFCDAYSIGAAVYSGAKLTNSPAGIIDAGDGLGVFVGAGATLDNQGRILVREGIGVHILGMVYNSGSIEVTNGVGIQGGGKLYNSGSISVTGTGSATLGEEETTLTEGAVSIDEDGIKLNDQYIAIGGTFTAHEPIVLDGAFVDITKLPGTSIPLFTAPGVSGVIKLTPDFAKLGNGFSYHIENFIGALASTPLSEITIETSPLFITKQMADGSLMVSKKPYDDLTLGEQFKPLHDGLDSLLYNEKNDSELLKGMNSYLEGVYATGGEREFDLETARTLSELRGDIYATIQSRMQSVERAFDNAFEELYKSYNITKDSDKYSVIYHQGKFRDKTLGIDDYDYRVQGLLYMKEKEGRNFGNKWGWTLGFAVSRFDFDDAPTLGDKSKEDVYSLRAGLHFVKNFNDDDSLRWTSRVEAGYNRHVAERSIEIDKTYKNKASYNSWQVAFDNKIEKTVHRSLSSKVDLYAALNLEYGKFERFGEKAKRDGGALLNVYGNDYLSIQPEIGVSAVKRLKVGKKYSWKLEGNLAYARELGKNYERNHARVQNGNAGRYDLIRPGEEENILKGRVGLTFEKANKAGVTFEVEARKHSNRDKMDVRYGIRFKYVFEPWR